MVIKFSIFSQSHTVLNNLNVQFQGKKQFIHEKKKHIFYLNKVFLYDYLSLHQETKKINSFVMNNILAFKTKLRL